MTRARIHVDPEAAALFLIDLQPDFLPGGALAVAGGDRVIAPIGELMISGRFALQVATQDWHPPGHVSFASSHDGREPFDVIDLYGHEQTLWPDNCVQGSAGAALHPALPWERVAAVVRKGGDSAVDSYSGLRENWNRAGERPPTGLGGYLDERGVRQVFLCGLARDVCVAWTAEDAAGRGFETCVLWDLTLPVDLSGNAALRARLEERGVVVADRAELEH